jgi:hypothetical protein
MKLKGIITSLLFAAFASTASAQTAPAAFAAGNAKPSASATPAIATKSVAPKTEKKSIKHVYSVLRLQFDEKGLVVMIEPDSRFQNLAKEAMENAKINGLEAQMEPYQTIFGTSVDLASLLNAYAELGYELEQVIQPGFSDSKSFTFIFEKGE